MFTSASVRARLHEAWRLEFATRQLVGGQVAPPHGELMDGWVNQAFAHSLFLPKFAHDLARLGREVKRPSREPAAGSARGS
jgi:hypothetical protein